jgi:hypothetical protein
VCAFEVSGYITLNSPLYIRNPYITIAGQTAPSPGITIRGDQLWVRDTHDVLIQHIRVRVGATGGRSAPDQRDSIHISSFNNVTYNIIVDHISSSWAVDENFSVWSNGPAIHDMTISNSLISEGLHCSTHPKGCHSMGLIVGKGTENILVRKNLFIHDRDRNPLVRAAWKSAAVINNLVYNPGDWKGGRTTFEDNIGSTASSGLVIGNQLIEGPSSKSDGRSIFLLDGPFTSTQIYIADNICEDGVGNVCIANFCDNSIIASTPPINVPGLQILPSDEVYNEVLHKSGARPSDRDAVDTRVVNDVKNHTGSIIDSPDDVGGYPALAQNTRSLESAGLPSDSNGDIDGDGYTNLEEWLHDLDCNVGGNCPADPTQSDSIAH